MDLFIRAVGALSRVLGAAAAGLIALSVLVVCHMVALRYFLGRPTIWQTEFVTYCLVAATLLGSPYVLLHRGHVNMDIVPLYLGQRARFWLAVTAYLLSLGFCLLVTVYGFGFWHEAWSANWRSDSVVRTPLWLPYLALPVGMGVLSLQYVAELLALLSGRALPFGLPPRRGAAAVLAEGYHAKDAETLE